MSTETMTATPALVAEYQVRFTTLDTIGDERMATLSPMNLGEAIEACAHIQVNQETYQLPADAQVWVRVGDGAWRPWVGDATRGCEMAACDNRGAEPLSACDITHVCPACRTLIEQLTAIRLEQDANEAAHLAEQAGVAR
ncbi:hypothetical protein [Nonomuraea sp. NPDC049400]|uniref:hypothetical protein n=1 Tax=Nonomuraea sp. NPDC049400 TaxID=3364352 RepID=UPI00379A44E5